MTVARQEIYYPDIPDINQYQAIKDAALKGNLVIFIGAGASSVLGAMRWSEMAEDLICFCREKGKINFWEQKRAIDLYKTNPRKLITIARSKLTEKQYQSRILKALKGKKGLMSNFPIYETLSGIKAIFITTNIDSHFGKVLGDDNTYHDLQHFKSENIKAGKLFHIHGHQSSWESVVLTIDEYVQRYQKDEVRALLKKVFWQESETQYCVLFIGYSLEELEVIDFALNPDTDLRNCHGIQRNKAFILLPFFRSEAGILEFEKLYFGKMQIEVIPYFIDSQGYQKQLYQLVRTWRNNILPIKFNEKAKIIDEVLEGESI